MLSDPVIYCKEELDRFSSTNLGRKDVKSFFKSHECNDLCKQMKLTKQVWKDEFKINKRLQIQLNKKNVKTKINNEI